MFNRLDFNDLITKKDGRKYLLDSYALDYRVNHAETLRETLSGACSLLAGLRLPATVDNVLDICARGRDALLDIVDRRSDEWARGLDMPLSMLPDLREKAEADIAPESWVIADDCRTRYQRATEGLVITTDDFSVGEDGSIVIDTDAIAKRAEDSCMAEITPEMQADADALAEIAAKLRAYELRGVNALELVAKYAKSADAPSQLDRCRDIATRKHQPGVIFGPDLANALNAPRY